jgi:uncharacterized glyoxalase superfamily protein PhnB
MTTFTGITPNLVVADIAKSIAFYRDVLGFSMITTVPEEPPYIFALMQRDGVSVFLNDLAAAKQDPATPALTFGNTAMLYFTVTGIQPLYEAIRGQATIAMPLKQQFYGMTEFSVFDPDGYVVVIGERHA